MGFENFSLDFIFKKFKRKSYSNDFWKVALCCIIKDENDYLGEWVNYHLAIGVEHFFIYDNGSQKSIELTLKELNLLKYTTVVRIPGRNQHIKAYDHCLKNYGSTAQWIGFIDVDEFIVPTQDNFKSLPSFLTQFEEYGGLGMSWLIFGSNGHLTKPEGSQMENYTRRSGQNFLPNQHIKSIVQPKYVRSARKSHCFNYISGKFCVNENFILIPESFSENSIQKIQLNHYYCRSLEEFHQKISRGISDTKRQRKLEEFQYHDGESNRFEDRTILSVVEKFKHRV